MRIGVGIIIILYCSTVFGQSDEVQYRYLQKTSPGTALFLKASDDHFLFPRFDGKLKALIQVTEPNTMPAEGVEVLTVAGNVLSVQFFEKDLVKILRDENVEYIDMAWRLNSSKMLNDTSAILSQVDKVQAGLTYGLKENYLGTGVVAGIVDIGFQPENPNFLSMDGQTYRVKRWWNQSNNAGPKPAGFNYGTEFVTESAIQAARDDDGTHGTHVAGITAGSGFTTKNLKYRGMAPDADLVFVTIKYSNDSLAGSALGDYVIANPAIIDGFNYVYQYAAVQQKPAVCNLSWGMHTGPHDGTSLFDKAVESLTGPGKILCGSAGNDGGNQVHISGDLSNDTLYTFAVDRSRRDYIHESVYMDFWGTKDSALRVFVTLFDTLGNELQSSAVVTPQTAPQYKKQIISGGDTLWLTSACNPGFVNNGKPEILLFVESSNSAKNRIRIGVSGGGKFHAWNSGQVYRWTSGSFLSSVKGNNYSGKYLNGTSGYSVVENGGTGKSTITSGSYIARKEWIDVDTIYRAQNWLTVGEVSGFSSRGPLPDGRIKPDIASPGQNIVSSVNHRTFAGWMRENTLAATNHSGATQYWTLASGTSMASPHTAGVVALLLQQHPTLNTEQVKNILYKSATRDQFTGNDSNVVYGYGKINAFGAMKSAIQLGIENNHLNIGYYTLFPNPAHDYIQISGTEKGEVRYLITSFSGKKVSEGTTEGKILVNHLAPGLYYISLSSSKGKAGLKFIRN